MAGVAQRRRVQAIHQNTGALRVLHGLVHIHVELAEIAEAVDAVGDEQDLAPQRGGGPSADQRAQRSIRARRSALTAARSTQGLGGQGVIGGRGLGDTSLSVEHIGDANGGRSGLLHHKLAQVVEQRRLRGVDPFIDENIELRAGFVAYKRNPLGYR